MKKGIISMTVNKISNMQTSIQMQASSVKENIKVQNPVNIKNTESGISPLSSRYTYAIGSDGKRYVLQLKIDISSVRVFSSLA